MTGAISPAELDAAVAAGVVPEATAAALRSYVAQQRQPPPTQGERVRLASGFNDIFVVLGCALLLISLGWLAASAKPSIGAAAVALAAWALAEFFVRRRHLALPGITLMLVFVLSVFCLAGLLFEASAGGRGAACAVSTLAAWVHWRRFRVPATVAAGMASLTAAVLSLASAWAPLTTQGQLSLVFAAGVATFALALYWDGTDRQRLTARADTGFWLHLLAAPLMVHPIFAVIAIPANGASGGQLLAVAALYLSLAAVSLAIDRRALMVSALGYVLYACASLLDGAGDGGAGLALTALLIGSGLLSLSAFWATSRRWVLRVLPSALAARLTTPPHP